MSRYAQNPSDIRIVLQLKSRRTSNPPPQSPLTHCSHRCTGCAGWAVKNARLGLIPDRQPANSWPPIRPQSSGIIPPTPSPPVPCAAHSFSGFCCFMLGSRYLFYCLLSCPLSYAFSVWSRQTFHVSREKLRQSRYDFECISHKWTIRMCIPTVHRILRLSIDTNQREDLSK